MNNQLTQNDLLYDKVAQLIEQARKQVATTVNLAMVYTYFEIGRMIVQDEQQGKERAAYGKAVLKELATKLLERFGGGFSVENLDRMRFFFKAYDFLISSTPLTKFTLSWSHYLILMRIKNLEERNFYEIEATANNWGLKTLQRQYHSSLYERLALSRDKEGVKLLSQEGQRIATPQDIIKDPLVLEFLGLRTDAKYSETQLETRIINQLQCFMLELGKGFLFEARQKRFTFDEEHFFVEIGRAHV